MRADWVTSSAELPHEGQQIEFVLDRREVVMNGVYVQQTFRSHWSGYEVARVHSWRPADLNSSAAVHSLLRLMPR